MPLTPEQIAKIRQKEAATPDALKRNPLNAYTEGWFHVTLNVRNEAPLLGYITGDAEAPEGSGNAPHCVLTEIGKGVKDAWRVVTHFHPRCECEALQVMPEHIHALLHLLPGNREHLGRIINGLMIGSTHCYWDTLGIPWQRMRAEKDAAASNIYEDREQRTKWQDRDHTRSFRGPSLFVRGYNDVEAVTDEEIEIKRQYIRNNPRKRLIQGKRHECFRKYRHQHSRNWTAERALAAVSNDSIFRYDGARQESAMANVMARMNTDERGACLDYIGNRALLAAERKLPLICHRADACLFEQQKAAVLQAARDGAVVVSAFISPKERDIMKLLIQEQLPFVEILDNGIPEKYKGVGKAFYALAENRLCQITPWSYKYQKDGAVSREMCMVMNELVRVISGVKDDWWKGVAR